MITLDPTSVPDHTQLIQNAVDTCSEKGGGKVVLKAGHYYSGTIVLRDNVTLHLEKDAIVTAKPNETAYFHKNGLPTALIFADGAKNVGLSGEGTLDGNGRALRFKAENLPDWVEGKKALGTWIPAFLYSMPWRPLALVLLADCENVRMEGIRVEDSPRWTIHLAGCSDVVIRGLTVRSLPESCNGDGIDLDSCSDVLVEDCDIETGDDAVCLKTVRTFGLARPCRNITVRRCQLRSCCHAFCIGHETQDDFEDITFTDCKISGVGEYRCMNGLALGIIDGAAIRRVRVSNIEMTDVTAPFQLRISNEGRVYNGMYPSTCGSPFITCEGAAKREPGHIEDIAVENVTIRGAFGNSLLTGVPGHPLQNIAFRDIRLEFSGPVDYAAVLNDVPELESEYPDNRVWRFLPSYAFYCRHISGLEFSNFTATAAVQEKRPALLVKDVGSFACLNFQATQS